MTKFDQAGYLQSLQTILEFHESLGTSKNKFITDEYRRAHDEFVEMLKKERENETGKRSA